MDALRAEIKQNFVQICTISRHRRCIRYLMLLTVKEFLNTNGSNDTNGSIKSRREKEHELPLIILKLFFEYE